MESKLSISTLSIVMDLLNKEHAKRLKEDAVIQTLYKEGKDNIAKEAQKDFEANPFHPLGETWKAILQVQEQFDEYKKA